MVSSAGETVAGACTGTLQQSTVLTSSILCSSCIDCVPTEVGSVSLETHCPLTVHPSLYPPVIFSVRSAGMIVQPFCAGLILSYLWPATSKVVEKKRFSLVVLLLATRNTL